MRIGLASFGLGAYWDQFEGLRHALVQSNQRVAQRLGDAGASVVDVGLLSDADEGAAAGDRLATEAIDLLVVNLSTYATSSQVLHVVQRAKVPVLVIDLQPHPRMDHPNTDTGRWLEYCGACSLPEVSAALQRCGIRFRSVSGHLESDRAWDRISEWVQAAGVVGSLRNSRFGLLGHLYPGMLDIATNLTAVHAQLNGHVEVLEMDDLRERVESVTPEQIEHTAERARKIFELDDSVGEDDFRWAARVAVAQEALCRDFRLDGLAYYYRGLGGELYERIAAGVGLGASMLTGAGIPCAGEFDLRTALAMFMMDRLGAGGSFTEVQALNFDDDVVEMGHDGPAHIAISAERPLLRGLGLYHGKRGYGVSVEFSVRTGPVTLLGLTETSEGRYRMVVAEGETVPGPLLQIGNTTSRVRFGRDAGEWLDEWCSAGPAHHWALGVGHRASVLQKVADLLGTEIVLV